MIILAAHIITLFGCHPAANTITSPEIRIPVDSEGFGLMLEAVKGNRQLSSSEIRISTRRVYHPGFKDTVEIPVAVNIKNQNLDDFTFATSIDIETQRLKSGKLDCTGTLVVYAGGRKSGIVRQPGRDEMEERDVVYFESGSLYSLTSQSAVQESGPYQTSVLKLTANHNPDNTINSFTIKNLSGNFETDEENPGKGNLVSDVHTGVVIKFYPSGGRSL
jgi:hypothetical protein